MKKSSIRRLHHTMSNLNEIEGANETEEAVADVEISYVMPEDITASDFDVDAAAELAREAFLAEQARGDEASLETINEIADDLEAFQAEQARRAEEAAAREEAIRDRAERLGLVDTEEADGSEGEDGEEETTDEAAADDATGEAAADDATGEETTEEESLAAGGRPAGRRSVPRRRPAAARRAPDVDELPDHGTEQVYGYSLVASGGADLSEGRLATGGARTLLEVAQDARHLATSPLVKREAGTEHYLAQFQLHVPAEERFYAGEAHEAHNRAVEADLDAHVPAPTAADFTIAEDGSLVAGAACGITEHDYSVYDDSAVGELLTLATRVAPRGSLTQWEPTTTLCDIIDRLADNISCDEDTVKFEVTADCPQPMPACETCARYLIMRFNNFRARSAPETYETEIVKHLRAHMINKHLDHLHTILTDTSTVLRDLTGEAAYVGSIEKDFWTMLSIQAQGIRNEYCVAHDYALDAIVPRWFMGAIKCATSRQYGITPEDVTEAMIRRLFAEHAGARVQFVDWWQRLDKDLNEYPGWFDFLLMPANSWLELTQGTLNLGNVIRDSTSNANNQYTSFTEDFYATCRRKYGSRLVRTPLAVTGMSPGDLLIPASTVAGTDSSVRPTFALT